MLYTHHCPGSLTKITPSDLLHQAEKSDESKAERSDLIVSVDASAFFLGAISSYFSLARCHSLFLKGEPQPDRLWGIPAQKIAVECTPCLSCYGLLTTTPRQTQPPGNRQLNQNYGTQGAGPHDSIKNRNPVQICFLLSKQLLSTLQQLSILPCSRHLGSPSMLTTDVEDNNASRSCLRHEADHLKQL